MRFLPAGSRGRLALDPLTQGLIGAAAAQIALGRRLGPRAMLIGAGAGVLPDADVFIRSAADPLLAVEYHRQFTHSLAFIPVGGVVAALPWLIRKKRRVQWKAVVAASVTGYATHGLLDACTTYGTQLLWPFSNSRAAFHWISIIDPIFTLVLLIGTVLAAMRRSTPPAAIALAICLAWLGHGAVQRSRAADVQTLLAASRGHPVTRGEVFPTVGNTIVWRSLYRSGDTLYADRIRVPWFGHATFAPGASVPAVDEHDLDASQRSSPRIRRDFRRFQWFSDGWLARDSRDPSIIGDVRYSLRTGAFEAIWGVRFHPERQVSTEWVDMSRDREIRPRELWDEIRGHAAGYRPVAHSGVR